MHTLILAAASGTLLALAFPYPSLWPLAWVALVPLIAAISSPGGRRLLRGLSLGYVFGLFFFGINLRWAAELDPPGTWVLWLAFVAIEALVGALFGIVTAWFTARPAGSWWRPLAIASAWTLIEYVRAIGPYALTWGQISYSQLPTGIVVQMADVTGAIGVTFVVVLVDCVLADLLVWRTEHPGESVPAGLRGVTIGTAALAVVCLGYGVFRFFTLPVPKAELSTISCVQPSVDPHLKWDPKRFQDNLDALEKYTRQAVESDHAYLVVWPETAIPAPIMQNSEVLGRIRDLAISKGVYILVGSTETENPAGRSPGGQAATGRQVYNTATLFDPHGAVQGRYDKMHLVPFGEFLPLRSLLAKVPPFNEIVDLSAGQTPTVFTTSRFTFGTLICFESTFSDLTRDMVAAGAEMIVVITNDGWFNRTAAAEHHLAMSAMRAIENRVWVVQCGNTGVSAFIGPRGEVHAKTDLFVPTAVSWGLQPGSLGSIYLRFGDWFAAVVGLLFVACAFLRIRRPD